MPTLIVADHILTRGAHFAYLQILRPAVLETESGEDIFSRATTPEERRLA